MSIRQTGADGIPMIFSSQDGKTNYKATLITSSVISTDQDQTILIMKRGIAIELMFQKSAEKNEAISLTGVFAVLCNKQGVNIHRVSTKASSCFATLKMDISTVEGNTSISAELSKQLTLYAKDSQGKKFLVTKPYLFLMSALPPKITPSEEKIFSFSVDQLTNPARQWEIIASLPIEVKEKTDETQNAVANVSTSSQTSSQKIAIKEVKEGEENHLLLSSKKRTNPQPSEGERFKKQMSQKPPFFIDLSDEPDNFPDQRGSSGAESSIDLSDGSDNLSYQGESSAPQTPLGPTVSLPTEMINIFFQELDQRMFQDYQQRKV